MPRQGYFSNWRNVFGISFGLVYVLFTIWVIFHVPQWVPPESQNLMYKTLIAYAILNTIIFANADIRNKLFKVKLIHFIPRFLIFFVISLFIFIVVLARVDPLGPAAYQILASVPLWLLILHALVFATTESAIWQGFLDEKIGRVPSAIVFGLFHLSMWPGNSLFVVFSAALLCTFFSYVNWRFRTSKNDLVPAIAVHTAYNLVKLGLLVSVVSLI